MAVISCKRRAGSRRGPVRNAKGGWTYHESYVVRTDKVDDDGSVVVEATKLPKINTGYPNDAKAIVTNINPQQSSESDVVWYVEVTWTYGGPGGGSGSMPGNVMELPPTRNWTTVAYRESVQADLDGKKFVNSAGDPFDPPPGMLEFHQVLTMTMNRLSYNATEADKYINTINTDAITVDGKTHPKYSGKIIDYSGQMDFLSSGVPYWRMVIAIEFNKKLWHPLKVLDQGFRHKERGVGGGGSGESGDPVLTTDGAGVKFAGSILLDGNGFPLWCPHCPKDASAPVFLEFKVYKQLSFATLNLPLG